MAVASLVSRITGFLRQLALVTVLGLGVVNDSYTVANTLPNIVYELLLGGVLTSVMVPLLVRAQTEDADGGEAYTRRLLTVAGVVLAVATLAAMATAPLLTRLYLGDGAGPANPQLATAFAWLLLPQIFFYGVGALLGALLNTRGVFAPFAWAPVLNNVVVLAVLGVFVAVPGRITLDPVQLSDPKLLVLGIGTTLGIVAQALVLIPAVRRTGFHYRPLWGWDRRLTETGGLAVWVVAYVLIGQVGYIVTTRVAAGAAPGSVAIYSTAWLLLQVPYGVLGVSLLTALMPRMSRGRRRGAHARRRRRPLARHPARRRRPAAGQRAAHPVRARARRRPVLDGRRVGGRGVDAAGRDAGRVRVRAAAVRGDDVADPRVLRAHRQPHAHAGAAGDRRGEDPAAPRRALLPPAAVGRARAGRGERAVVRGGCRVVGRCCCTGASARWAPVPCWPCWCGWPSPRCSAPSSPSGQCCWSARRCPPSVRWGVVDRAGDRGGDRRTGRRRREARAAGTRGGCAASPPDGVARPTERAIPH